MRETCTEQILANGTRCLFAPCDTNNIVALSAFFPYGSVFEQPAQAGITDFMWRCLLRGTQKRSQAEYAEAVESLGSSLSFQAYRDFSTASLVCTSDCLEPTLELFFEAIESPRFDPNEIEKERQSTLAAIREELDDKATFAMRAFAETLFGGSTYGIPVPGTLETVPEFKIEQVIELYNRVVGWNQALVVCVGNFEPSSLAKILERSASKATGEPRLVCPSPSYYKGELRVIRREWEQSYLVLGFPACPVTHRDFFPLRMLAGVLGDGMSSRFFVRLRDERGLAYATSCHLAAFRCGGYLAGTIGTKPESLDEARELMLQLLSEVCQELVPDDEIERTRNYLVGKYLISHQKNSARAFYLGSYEMNGLGWQMDHEYPLRLKAVCAEDVREVARQYLDAPTIIEIRPVRTENSSNT
ncbi:MAG: M16 family metallopeptidase [Candidatus Sumerlaeaceae bacterium]|jgi:predicted Zn-dependent peptidase